MNNVVTVRIPPLQGHPGGDHLVSPEAAVRLLAHWPDSMLVGADPRVAHRLHEDAADARTRLAFAALDEATGESP